MIAYLTFILAATPAAVDQSAQSQVQCENGQTTDTANKCPPPPAVTTKFGVQCADGKMVPQARECSEAGNIPLPIGPRAATPRGNPSSWATTDDYPMLGTINHWEGTTAFRLDVGRDGRVATCQVTSSSGYALMDVATCRHITRRARFNPALNEDGNPIIGRYANRIRWVLPSDDVVNRPVTWRQANERGALSNRGPNKAPDPIGMQRWLSHEPFYSAYKTQVDMHFGLQIGSHGRVTSCEAFAEGPKEAAARDVLCKELKARASFRPATDANGYRTTGSFSANRPMLNTIHPVVKKRR
jgi:TonB family protein